MSSPEDRPSNWEADYQQRVDHAYLVMLARRRAKSMTQQDFAALLSEQMGKSVSQPTASEWLKGVEPRNRDARIALATVLGCDAGWLYFGPAHSSAPRPEFPDPNEPTLGARPRRDTKDSRDEFGDFDDERHDRRAG